MSFGLRRNTRIREDTLHYATEDGRYKAKQLQQERKVKEYKDTIEKLEKKIVALETERQVQHDQLQAQEKRHEEALYQSAVTNRENHVQFEKYQKLTEEKQKVEEQSKYLNDDVKSLRESSNILRAAHERLFADYQSVGKKYKLLEAENLKLKDENEDLNRSVTNLKVYKDKFVAANKEIVKIYRDKQKIAKERVKQKDVSDKMEQGYLMAIDELNERLKHSLDTIRVVKRKYDITHAEFNSQKEESEKQIKLLQGIKDENKQLKMNLNAEQIKNENNATKIDEISASLTAYADDVARKIDLKENLHKKMVEGLLTQYHKKLQKANSSMKLQKQLLEERARDDVNKLMDQQEVLSEQLMSQIKRLAKENTELKNKNKLLQDENRRILLRSRKSKAKRQLNEEMTSTWRSELLLSKDRTQRQKDKFSKFTETFGSHTDLYTRYHGIPNDRVRSRRSLASSSLIAAMNETKN
eukprot:g1469.t1